ncbi:cytochrome c biogenesis protein DipZ [Cypionkella psychrotolerans]|uniref:cytochrome c biogenesis protein DipZ n=1 Tax=Cypionkella psychrotolerans TaxID=1678131 RepID=UPI0009E705A5|nr:redoxin family protein [Cypionkella psychrotolerans]
MLLLLLAYLGGMLTIASPCILPVLPFVFARAGQPFLKSTLPMLAGMAATFAAVASLAAIGGDWAVTANQYGRSVALVVMAGFGMILLFPAMADKVARPVVALGARLSDSADRHRRAGGSVVAASLVLGTATGLLWAPCAGPMLGLILTGAALNGANLATSLLLLAYALGAATSLALALLVGGRVFQAMKRSLLATEWLRRGFGVAVILAAFAIGLGVDTKFLAQASYASTAILEQRLLDSVLQPHAAPATEDELLQNAPASATEDWTKSDVTQIKAQKVKLTLPVESTTPDLNGAVQWLNSEPLSMAQLKGKVVLVNFWTFGCINCLHTLPYVKEWAAKYADQGFVVIGVHSPEFAFEKDRENVKNAVADLGISFPVALDNDFAIWRQFNNRYWPAQYLIDADGQVRFHHFGEGSYDQSEQAIRRLIAERDKAAP